MNLNFIASVLSNTCSSEERITGVCTDSRVLKPGHLYIALQGERFDGHDFVLEAQSKGAIAAVVQKTMPGVTIPQWVVQDTVQALAKIATAYRKDISCPVIALTGSNGKTTVKEMIAACLPKPSLATKGNLNNHIGVPLTVLDLAKTHRYAVFELGANHSGEIAHTVAIVKPEVTLINNIAPAHVEGFGSIEGVARAKGEIYQGLAPSGIAVVNDDDAYAHFWDDLLLGKKVLRFSTTHVADVYAENIHLDANGFGQFELVFPESRAKISLQVPGRHNVSNAVAAASCCFAVGVSIEEIQKGLNDFHGVKGRMTLLSGRNQATVIDDTYNANLRSVLTALEVLAQRQGKKIFVFGDMGELGDWAKAHHQEVGLEARRLGIDRLLSCGSYSALASKAFGVKGQHFASQEALVTALLEELGAQTTVLVKGSRSSAMEKIVNQVLF
jgi:UDP-N-acetylmuramoyl-tripeptide--D-alanyl-D-alanine ligase